jgi:tRNA(His) 5'-end guanylyltransferase
MLSTLLYHKGQVRTKLRCLKKEKSSDRHELLFKFGINISKVPAWQRKGILVHKEKYSIEGYNPLTHENTISSRSKIAQNWDIPLFASTEGKALIDSLIENS